MVHQVQRRCGGGRRIAGRKYRAVSSVPYVSLVVGGGM